MEFFNETEYAAYLFRSEFENEILHNSLITRIRYILSPQNILIPAAGNDRLQDIRRDVVGDENGSLKPDSFFPRTASDLIIFADATAPHGSVTQLPVRVTAGPAANPIYDLKMMVFGDRTWQKNNQGKLMPSRPVPFEKMPLVFNRAYGGTVSSEYGNRPNLNNPAGVGDYASEEAALDNALPNIEDPENLIQAWDDHPNPVGVAPYEMQYGLRVMTAIQVDEEQGTFAFTPQCGIFDQAFPRLAGKQLSPGHVIQLSGMSTEPTVSFALPACPFAAFVHLGQSRYELQPRIEEIVVDLRTGFVDIAYRALFHYDFVPHQERRTVLCGCDNLPLG